MARTDGTAASENLAGKRAVSGGQTGRRGFTAGSTGPVDPHRQPDERVLLQRVGSEALEQPVVGVAQALGQHEGE